VDGDLIAEYFYIVQDGSFEIFVATDPGSYDPSNPGPGVYVSTVTKGGSFGELALLYLVPRAATVTAKSESPVWVIDRMTFKSISMAEQFCHTQQVPPTDVTGIIHNVFAGSTSMSIMSFIDGLSRNVQIYNAGVP